MDIYRTYMDRYMYVYILRIYMDKLAHVLNVQRLFSHEYSI